MRINPINRIVVCRRALTVAATLVAVVGLALPAIAQDAQDAEPELGWANSTEAGLSLTTGNSNTTNFNVRNLYTYDWANADLDWEFGFLRATSDDDRFAVGTEDMFEVIRPERDPDNSRIFTSVRYQREIRDSFFWYARFFTERDRPADIDYRVTPSAGFGRSWVRSDDLSFSTGFGISYTDEQLTLESRSFAGYQLLYNLTTQFTETTKLDSRMTLDGSFQTGKDIRFDWYNGIGVNITDSLALSAAIRLIFRNDPALEEIDLENPDGVVIGTVVVPKEKLDSQITMNLVLNF